MIEKKLRDIERFAKGRSLDKKFYEKKIKGVSTDTRTLKKGNLFIPLVGDNFDGHKFLDQAIEKGALASFWQKDVEKPDIDFPFIMVDDSLTAIQTLAKNYRASLDSLQVIGITGSNGKTTTKDIMDGILSTSYRTEKTMGNLNNHIGVPLTLLSLKKDTEIAIVEMGTDGFGQIELLTKLACPDMAIITNIAASHLDLLKNKENVAHAKFEILAGLKKDGVFIYNGDDETLIKLVGGYNIGQKVFTFGEDPSNDFSIELLEEGREGIRFNIIEKGDRHSLHLPMLGRHNIYNAAAAIIVSRQLGLDYNKIQEGFYNIKPTDMRNEILEAHDFTILNDAYKSNPSSLLAALDTLYSLEGYEKKAVILGDMLDLGEDIVKLHREIGPKIDPNQVDQIFTIGDLAQEIGQGARVNFKEEDIYHSNSKEELVNTIEKNIHKGSLALVKASRSLALETVIDRLVK